jgi:hypothetical protein
VRLTAVLQKFSPIRLHGLVLNSVIKGTRFGKHFSFVPYVLHVQPIPTEGTSKIWWNLGQLTSPRD